VSQEIKNGYHRGSYNKDGRKEKVVKKTAHGGCKGYTELGRERSQQECQGKGAVHKPPGKEERA